MKKVLALFLTCMVTLLSLPAMAELTAADAVEMATRQATISLDGLPYKTTLLPLTIDGIPQNIWIVSHFPSEPSGTVHATTIHAASGEVLDQSTRHFWEFADLWASWGYGDYDFWSPQEKALYHSVYQLIPTRLVPDESAIPQEKALQIARDTVQQIYQLSETDLSAYQPDFSYVPNWYVRQPTDAWLIMLRPVSKTGSLYQIVVSAVDGTVFTCDQNDEAYPTQEN